MSPDALLVNELSGTPETRQFITRSPDSGIEMRACNHRLCHQFIQDLF